ncbi:methylamine utilization protein [Saccharospirillum salsuginis]|uniref:Methylamine utilization protein n=1 Tax=Saccharospirillum salsuginis TaxID=418750 RepID=A0A918KL48_9GAMM|nr:methylamine utilization protein [Saccharospirillum salsuginis]GGX67553.1 hypothetical protein GCM10007392_38980 [Saccharospirillum salsuginis]
MRRLKTGLLGLLGGVWIGGAAQAATLPGLTLVDLQGQPVSEAVLVLEGAETTAPEGEPGEAIVDQVDLEFVPRVAVVRAGTRVRFPNSDDTRHHVYSFSPAKTFELQLYQGNEAPPVEFDQSGLVVLGCNIHDSMRGYIYVVDSQIYGVSDAQGRITLPAYSEGSADRVTLWHPDMKQSMSLSLSDLRQAGGETLEIQLPFTLPETEPEPEGSGLRNRLQRYKNNGD